MTMLRPLLLPLCRSTILDAWTWEQLRLMKVGGNERARAFFAQHGNLHVVKDIEAKYGCAIATQYKEKLRKLMLEDEAASPERPVLNLAEAPRSPRPAFPGMIGKPESSGVSSSSSSLLKLGRPTQDKPAKPLSENGPMVLGLGATKHGHIIGSVEEFDFDQVAQEALQAAESSKAKLQDEAERLRLDEEQREMEQLTWQQQQDAVKAEALSQKPLSVEEQEAMQRLGMGMRRVRLQAAAASVKTSSSVPSSSMTATAPQPGGNGAFQLGNRPKGAVALSRDAQASSVSELQTRFSSAKGISSDDYFASQQDQDQETRSRLRNFEGSSGISSDDYFGRNSPSQDHRLLQHSDGSPSFGFGSLSGDLDPVDLARRVAERASVDFESLKNAISWGVSSAYQEFQNRYGSGAANSSPHPSSGSHSSASGTN